MGAELCALPAIAAISCSLSQEHMAATRRYIAKTVRAAITSFCLKGILYNRRASWSTPCQRGEAPRTCFAFDIYHFLPGRRSERRPIITILLIFVALTSSVTLNLFSKATNFCLKLGCCNRKDKDTQVHFITHSSEEKKKAVKKGVEAWGGRTVAIKFA